MLVSPPFLPPQAVFLDRDGTIIEERHYLSDPDQVVLLPGAGEALGRLQAAGCKLFLVSNQSGIGRGYFGLAELAACQKRLDDLLGPYGAAFDDTRCCPHAPEDQCACRKPRTGMWDELRAAWQLDAARCAMVGDKPEDLLFGARAGFAAAFLVLTGHGRESAAKLGLPHAGTAGVLPPERLEQAGYVLPQPLRTRLAMVPSLADAVEALLGGLA